MLNSNGKGRTNYFRVENTEAFEKALIDAPVDVHQHIKNKNHVCLISTCESGSFSSYNEDDKEACAIDITKKHLCDGELAVFMKCGSEKHPHLHDCAVAINNKGEAQALNLNNIYELATSLGVNVYGSGF